jgi:catechol 2,3-dioxygenase-like lactoylglutathione lyase family enzyme
MDVPFAHWTLDVPDVERMAEFWAAALGYRIERSEDGSVHLRPDEPGRLSVWLQPTDEPKTGKNRDHSDSIVADGTVEAKIGRPDRPSPPARPAPGRRPTQGPQPCPRRAQRSRTRQRKKILMEDVENRGGRSDRGPAPAEGRPTKGPP